MRIEPEIAGVSLVMLGHFNPAIFTPAWFGWNELLPEKTVEDCRCENRPILKSRYSRQDWLNLHVQPESFQNQHDSSPPMFACGTWLSEFSEKTFLIPPLAAMGINREVHFSVRSFDERDRLGRLLAPVEPWGALGTETGTRWGAWWYDFSYYETSKSGRQAAGRTNKRNGGTIQPDRPRPSGRLRSGQ